MKIEYDQENDVKYVYIKEGLIARTQEAHDWLLLDRAANDDILGIEILFASRHEVNIPQLLSQYQNKA